VEPKRVVADALALWHSPLEHALFGTSDPGQIVDLLSRFCLDRLGSGIARIEFYRRGVGAVFGIDLADGRRVAIKVHRREIAGDDLDAVQDVQRAVADAGLPAPRPIQAPAALRTGIATVEELLDRGSLADGHRADVRRRLAVELHRFVEAASRAGSARRVAVAHPFDLKPDELWPTPHDLRFDFALEGGEWIDEIALGARAELAHGSGRSVVGHMDWRVENLRFDDTRLAAIFDWDSVRRCREPALVGMTAAAFTADWSGAIVPYPTPEESQSFVEDYSAARGEPMTAGERSVADAAYTYQVAYGARCEYSDEVLKVFANESPARGWRALLRAHRHPLF
jgi:hypothetical protein